MNRGLLSLVVTLGFGAGLTCGGGDGGSNGETQAVAIGETCVEENVTACGEADDGTEAAAVCTKMDTAGTLKWTEQDTCKKYEHCQEDSACVVDCDSAFICDDKECGDDGCGGNCGACDQGMVCMSGVCTIFSCIANCEGRECGPDGCGDVCGNCAGELVCSPPDYGCIQKPANCSPDCLDKQCGPNGCGGSCGSCAGGTFCDPDTQTCKAPCVPDCTGKVCGNDGCGGDCGDCDGDLHCDDAGQCVLCDPVNNLYCDPGFFCTYVAEAKEPSCAEEGTQLYGNPCGGVDTCSEGVCVELSSSDVGPLCYKVCIVHSDCGEGQQCMDLENSPYKVCSVGAQPYQTCSLTEQDCEFEDEACYYISGANEAVCLEAGTKGEGETCQGQPNECAEGFACLSTSGLGWICRKFCSTDKGLQTEDPAKYGCPTEPYSECTNYYSLQQAGYCKEE